MATAAELPIDTGATALQMADAMFGNGITLVSASYTGAVGASGIYSDGNAVAPGVTPSDTGVILSTGLARDITNSSGDPNVLTETSTDHGAAGNAGLTTIAGMQTFDAAILEADFIPAGDTLTMQVVFASEEYLEYVNSGFNDVVGIWVNGVQAQLTVGSSQISIDNINDQSNANLYVDNPATADTYNTEMDGFTVTLTLKAPVNPGVTNTIRIGIADGGDGLADSNLLIAGNSVQTALIANDDDIFVRAGTQASADLLANDSSSMGGTLTITEINGQPVSIGDTVALPSGQTIELTATGFVLVTADGTLGEDFFTYTVADGFGNTDTGFVKLTTTPCFVAGTRILTPEGERAVETLRPGDLVTTLDRGAQPLLWVGRSSGPAQGPNAPVHIAAGMFGATRDTAVSPQHRLLLRDARAVLLADSPEVLVRARHLENGGTVARREAAGIVRYVHLLFPRHEIVFGDGVPSESYQPGPQTIAAFGPAQSAVLRRLLRRHGIARMQAARPVLSPHEARLLAPRAEGQDRMRQPVRNIHQITARQSAVKPAMASSDTKIGTSANP